MADDVILNKAGVIERCVARVREEHDGNDDNLMKDFTRQDSIILNLQRACEATIDLAMHLVKVNNLGVPQESRDAFSLLAGAGLLEDDAAAKLMKMVGFRDIAVHDYRTMNLDVVRSIVHNDLNVFLDFSKWAILSHQDD
jgi:uncharacterized protein YutE (UPF0331/DUF86 family)